MKNINLDYKSALGFFSEEEIINVKEQVKAAHNALQNKTGAGNDFLGWVTLPEDYDKEEFARIKAAADKIRQLHRLPGRPIPCSNCRCNRRRCTGTDQNKKVLRCS